MNIGKAVKFYRQSKRITLRTLSDNTSLAIGHLSDLENGKKEFLLPTLEKICEALGVPMLLMIFTAQSKEEQKQMPVSLQEKMSSLVLNLLK